MTPKEYYKNYLADNSISPLNVKLANLIKSCQPNHVLEFGCGTGKNLAILDGVATAGIDISFLNIIHSRTRNDVPFVMYGDETHLRHLCNFDVVFTCSVLDHIEDIDGIIGEFKRIANKNIIIAETNDKVGQYYYPHDYESFGFEKLKQQIDITSKVDIKPRFIDSDDYYQWISEADGARYNIWMFNKVEA